MNPINYITKEPWIQHVQSVLKGYDYVLLKTTRILGIVLALFVRRKYLTYIRNLRISHKRTGFGGYLGNKGGVSISFDFMETSIAIVNCHLAPHLGEYEHRVASYKSIAEQMLFYKSRATQLNDHEYVNTASGILVYMIGYHTYIESFLYPCSYVFWIGDMNFRLDDLDTEQVVHHIADNLSRNGDDRKNGWNHLLSHDQVG